MNDKAAEEDLGFIAYYDVTPLDRWRDFVAQTRTLHPLFWQARWLVLAAVVAWGLGVGWLFGQLLLAGSQYGH